MGRARSEVALSAEVDGQGSLILERVGLLRQRSRCGPERCGYARPFLIQTSVEDFSTERQVLNRRPTGTETDLEHVEVRITDRGSTGSSPVTQPVSAFAETELQYAVLATPS